MFIQIMLDFNLILLTFICRYDIKCKGGLLQLNFIFLLTDTSVIRLPVQYETKLPAQLIKSVRMDCGLLIYTGGQLFI